MASAGVSDEEMRGKLTEAFAPAYLKVEGETDGCGDKFSIIVVSDKFEGVGVLDRQRQVNGVLEEAGIMKRLHALSMKCWTPAQARKKGVLTDGDEAKEEGS